VIKDFVEAGEIHAYNMQYDKAKGSKPLVLQKFKEDFKELETLEDKVIERLASEGKAEIFATELALAAIMTAGKSMFSWDVVIKRFKNQVFIDKRDEENILDFETVNETSMDN